MDKQELLDRTYRFALDIVLFVNDFPKNTVSYVISKQIAKSGTSVGANYRAACRGKSESDFSYKIKIVEEEADETLFWLKIIKDSRLISNIKLDYLIKEADELTAIFTSISKTLKQK